MIRILAGDTGCEVRSSDFNNGTFTSKGLTAPVVQQGGGLVNAFRFVKSTTDINPGFIGLNVSVALQHC